MIYSENYMNSETSFRGLRGTCLVRVDIVSARRRPAGVPVEERCLDRQSVADACERFAQDRR